MSISASRVDGLVAAELALGADAGALAGGACFLLWLGCRLVVELGFKGIDIRREWQSEPRERRRGR